MRYKETVSSVLIAADDSKFVVVTGRFHYIFDAPPGVVRTLKGRFHSFVEASFTDFRVAPNGKTRGQLSLLMRSAPETELQEALAAGFRMVSNGAALTASLNGERFLAHEMTVGSAYKLNRPYTIEVVNEQPVVQTRPTPVKVNVVEKVLVLAGVTLLALTVATCQAIEHSSRKCY